MDTYCTIKRIKENTHLHIAIIDNIIFREDIIIQIHAFISSIFTAHNCAASLSISRGIEEEVSFTCFRKCLECTSAPDILPVRTVTHSTKISLRYVYIYTLEIVDSIPMFCLPPQNFKFRDKISRKQLFRVESDENLPLPKK
jgi:hypothetical protein